MNADAARKNRYQGTLAVWYSTHYQVDSRDFDNVREFHGRHHPQLGSYRSDDAAVLRTHLQWMQMEQAYVAKYIHKESNPDYDAIRRKCDPYAAAREDGRFFEKQMLRAREGDPRIILLSTWNDWQFANQIEPAVEYGFQYVDLAGRLAGREAETEPYRGA